MRGFLRTETGFVALASIATFRRHSRLDGVLMAYDANSEHLGDVDRTEAEEAGGDAVIPNTTGLGGAMLMIDPRGVATWQAVPLVGWQLSPPDDDGQQTSAPIFGDFAMGNTRLYVEMPDGSLIDYRHGMAEGLYTNREQAAAAFREDVARRRQRESAA